MTAARDSQGNNTRDLGDSRSPRASSEIGTDALPGPGAPADTSAAQDRWCGEVTAHEAHGWPESGQEYACDGVPLADSQASSAGQDGIPDSRCVDCGRVKASDEDWRTYDEGEADELCWGTNCELDYDERRWLAERFLFWVANCAEIAAFALAKRRRAAS